jgi:hypothetical protein
MKATNITKKKEENKKINEKKVNVSLLDQLNSKCKSILAMCSLSKASSSANTDKKKI